MHYRPEILEIPAPRTAAASLGLCHRDKPADLESLSLTLHFTDRVWFCFDLNVAVFWFFPLGVRKDVAFFFLIVREPTLKRLWSWALEYLLFASLCFLAIPTMLCLFLVRAIVCPWHLVLPSLFCCWKTLLGRYPEIKRLD